VPVLFKWLFTAWIANFLALFLISRIFRGIRIQSLGTAVGGGLLLGLVNAVTWKAVFFFPQLFWLTKTATLGCLSSVVMAVFVWFVSFFVPGMEVRGFWTAVAGGISLGIINAVVKTHLL
jgi:putative membrane protein